MDSEGRVNVITCMTWVPKGVAKANPEKVEVTKEELKKIIEATQEGVNELEEVEESAYVELEKEANKGDVGKENVDRTKPKGVEETIIEEMEDVDKKSKVALKKMIKAKKDDKENKVDPKEDIESIYNLEDYDDEDDDNMKDLLKLGLLTVHASNDEDPYVTLKDRDDADSDQENHEIKPDDNLIAVGHLDGDAAILEVHVYNPEESTLYVHHDILLPSVPLCMEWLNYDSGDQNLKPSNMLAVGTMNPVIEVWDIDLIDCLEPAYKLGRKAKKKKKIAGIGHKDAVLALSWNKLAEHVLASGSVDNTVIVWDLEHGSVGMQLKPFTDKVQALQWHYQESQSLITGSCDSQVRIFDCRSDSSFKSWKLDGEVECVAWDKTSGKPFNCLASTDAGSVYYLDARQDKPLWTLSAHNKACTGMTLSPSCPGCLVTTSVDKTVKVWDIASGKPEFIEEKNPRHGVITSLSTCPDAPFIFSMGGDNKENNFSVWDIRESRNVRTRFCARVGLPEDAEDAKEMETEEAAQSLSQISISAKPEPVETTKYKPQPKPKFGKKKGGHLDKKKSRKH